MFYHSIHTALISPVLAASGDVADSEWVMETPGREKQKQVKA